MGRQQKASINIGKALMSVSLPTLAAMGSATGNVWVAGLAALPAVVLASSETWKAALRSFQSQKESLLELPVPGWWDSDRASWQGVCAEIEQILPRLLEGIERRLRDFQEVVTVEELQQFFIEALAKYPLTWAYQEEDRKKIGTTVAAPILTKLEQVLNPLVEQKQRETALRDIHSTSTTAARVLSVLEQLHEDLTKQGGEENLAELKARYFAAIQEKYQYMDLAGISPKVTSRAEARVVKIKMEDVYVQLKFRQDLGIAPKPRFLRSGNALVILDGLDESGTDKAAIVKWVHRHIGTKEGTEAEAQIMSGLPVVLSLPSDQTALVEISKVLQYQKSIILGHPGTGKSTITKYVAYAIARGRVDAIGEHLQGAIPVVVKAAEYGKYLKKDNGLSFYSFVTGSRYSDAFGPLFKWALLHNQCLVIIDGLDELSDPILRVRVGKMIQEFASTYHQNRFLITSRIVGYRGNELVGDFAHFELEEWQPDQIIAYLEKWYFALEEKKSPAIEAACKSKAQELWEAIKTKEGVRKLAGTPLLLAIIALIHQYGRKLPERRVAFYELATETLLNNWPLKERELQLDSQELLTILEPIAHRIFTSSPDRLITEYEFLPLFEEQVREVQGINSVRVKKASHRLLAQIEQHTGFFLSRGTNELGQQVYGFLHATFVEYLAARYLAQQWVLPPHHLKIEQDLHEANWHEVILLMAGHLGMMMMALATQFVEYIEQVKTPYEQVLHRNLLLVADILADKALVSREKVTTILSRIILVALETPFFPLFESICQQLQRIAAVIPITSLPGQLRVQSKDPLPLQVRKVTLARSLKLQNQEDLEILVRGLLLDEKTWNIARVGLTDFLNASDSSKYVLVISEGDFPKGSFSYQINSLTKQVVAKIQSLQLPVLTIDQLVGQPPDSSGGTRQVWLLDLEKYPNMSADLLNQITTGQMSFVELVLRLTLPIYNTIFHQVLFTWVNQLSEPPTGKAYHVALQALATLPDIVESKSLHKGSAHSTLKTTLSTIFTTSDSSDDRAKALKALLWLLEGSKEWNAYVRKALEDPAKEVLAMLARVLSDRPSQERMPGFVVERLRPLLRHTDAEIRWSVAKAFLLKSLFEEKDIPLLLENIMERLRGITTTEELCTLVGYILRLTNQTGDQETIDVISGALIQSLEKEVTEENILAFSRLSYVLAHRFAEPLVQKIQPFLNHKEVQVRRRAALIGAAIQPEWPFISCLLDLLEENDSELRLTALQALLLTNFEEEQVGRRILETIYTTTGQTRVAAMNVISKRSLQNVEEVEVFLDVLQHGEQIEANAAVAALSQVQDPTLRKHVIEQIGPWVIAHPQNIPGYTLLWNLLVAKPSVSQTAV